MSRAAAGRVANPERYAEENAKARERRARERAVLKALRDSCCERKTDLIRGKGRLIGQCAKCGAMVDMGAEPEPIDRFMPVWEQI